MNIKTKNNKIKKIGLRGPKIIEISKFWPHFFQFVIFLPFSKTLYPSKIFFNIFFINYLFFQTFWCNFFENCVKTQVMVLVSKLFSCFRLKKKWSTEPNNPYFQVLKLAKLWNNRYEYLYILKYMILNFKKKRRTNWQP